MQDFRVQITGYPEEEECVAEIWHADTQVAMLSFGRSGDLQISVFATENDTAHKLSADRYLKALADARKQLIEARAPKTDTSQYQRLLMLFISGLMPFEDYARSFRDTFLAEKRMFAVDSYAVLNRLFTDIDVFNPDVDSRLEHEIGFEELMASAKKGLSELRKPA